MLAIDARNTLEHLFILGAIETRIGENHRAEAVLTDASGAVLAHPHVTVLKLHAADLVLEALLERDELVHGEQALEVVAEKVLVQVRVVTDHAARHVRVLVTLTQRGLVTDDRLKLLKLLQIDVAVAVQVEHVKRDREMPSRSLKEKMNYYFNTFHTNKKKLYLIRAWSKTCSQRMK